MSIPAYGFFNISGKKIAIPLTSAVRQSSTNSPILATEWRIKLTYYQQAETETKTELPILGWRHSQNTFLSNKNDEFGMWIPPKCSEVVLVIIPSHEVLVNLEQNLIAAKPFKKINIALIGGEISNTSTTKNTSANNFISRNVLQSSCFQNCFIQSIQQQMNRILFGFYFEKISPEKNQSWEDTLITN